MVLRRIGDGEPRGDSVDDAVRRVEADNEVVVACWDVLEENVDGIHGLWHVLSDVVEAISLEPDELEGKGVYSVELALGPRNRIWRTVSPGGRFTGLVDEEISTRNREEREYKGQEEKRECRLKYHSCSVIE